jgi:cyclophilin family peptidyl-prolyl cis-trans isomerase
MIWFLRLLLAVTLLPAPAWAGPLVEMKTSLGDLRIELHAEKAPQTVANFLAYVDAGFYDETIFHRVIDGFMLQGGGFSPTLKRKETAAPIANEADNGLKNIRGSIAMARSGAIDSATSQFFINLADNDFLNHRGKAAQTYGYAVFGQVVAGMDVVAEIGRVKTIAKNRLFKDYPEQQVVIEAIRRIEPSPEQ